MLDADGAVRPAYAQVASGWRASRSSSLKRKQQEAETLFRRLGITFSVYGSENALERLIPFDLVPRIISAAEWRLLERGIEQRVRALNAFLYDIYHRQEIIRAGRVPADLVMANEAYLPEMIGHAPPLNVYSPHHRRRHRARRARTSSTCWRTICARRPASPTCWRTARR